jgi:DNA-binding MarR family transcriptional regulator
MGQRGSDRPIGFLIKRVDALLTERMANALASQDLSRFHWQALNLIYEEGVGLMGELADLMVSFVDFTGVEAIITDLEARGWVDRDGESLAATPAGRDAHSAIQTTIGGFRRDMTAGITEPDYAVAVGVLERMATNLAAQDADSPAR